MRGSTKKKSKRVGIAEEAPPHVLLQIINEMDRHGGIENPVEFAPRLIEYLKNCPSPPDDAAGDYDQMCTHYFQPWIEANYEMLCSLGSSAVKPGWRKPRKVGGFMSHIQFGLDGLFLSMTWAAGDDERRERSDERFDIAIQMQNLGVVDPVVLEEDVMERSEGSDYRGYLAKVEAEKQQHQLRRRSSLAGKKRPKAIRI